jgi:Short C-terminal domain
MTRFAPRIAIVVSILTLVSSIIGFVAVMILNAFVLDEYDAYGEVPIPGSSSLHLPAGEVTVSFHTLITGRPTSGFPIPEMGLRIDPPAGVPEPDVTESIGGTTTVNSDVHVRVWVVQIHQPGTYDITTDGNVSAYINPRLAFGHDSSYGWLPWLFGGLFVLGLLELFAALAWAAKAGKKARPLAPHELLSFPAQTWSAGAPPAPPASSYTPTDQGIRIQQLQNLAALRDSGALTEEEFEAEKRRILET